MPRASLLSLRVSVTLIWIRLGQIVKLSFGKNLSMFELFCPTAIMPWVNVTDSGLSGLAVANRIKGVQLEVSVHLLRVRRTLVPGLISLGGFIGLFVDFSFEHEGKRNSCICIPYSCILGNVLSTLQCSLHSVTSFRRYEH